MWFGRRLLRSLGKSAIWNSPSITAFYGNSGTKFWGCLADCVPEFSPRAMRIAPRELLQSFPRAVASDTIAVACRPGDSRRRCEAWTSPIARRVVTCSRFAMRSVGATGQWRYGLNGRGRANSLTDHFVTEAPPTARKASCFRQPISARIALARPQCGDLTCA